jgi:uncharacterized protein YjbI with pentapeptide repeats
LPVKESISAHEILKKLEEAEAKDLRVCAVSNREVSDPLDLSSRKVKVAMDIQNCDFQREVDLSYCDFEQTVDFSDCTFHSDFIAGDKDKSYTVFRKDLLCNRAVFNGAARFRGVRCEGKALFRDTWFQREGEEADFGSASFKEALDYENSIFFGGANFELLHCGVGSFKDALFRNKVMLVNFTAASFQSLICSDTRFKGPVTFYGMECKISATFTSAKFQGNTQFEGEANRPPFALTSTNFAAASFKHLDFSGAIFEGPVSFVGLECQDSALFIGARFLERIRHLPWKPHASVDFADASFRFLNCSHADFEGRVRFYGVNCAVRGLFQGARFDDNIDFATTSFNYLDCSSAEFWERANFSGLKCADGASFHDVLFVRGVNFAYAYFGSNVEFTWTCFNSEVSLEEAKILGKLDVTLAEFHDSASFYGADIGRLVFDPFYVGQGHDLRECTFAWFTTTQDEEDQARALLAAQDPMKFSSDPYVQLENYFNRIGNRDVANKMYHKGRVDRRTNAKDTGGKTKWTRRQRLGDGLLKWLSGYGVKTWLLFVYSSFFVVFGTLMFTFWPSSTLVEAPASSAVLGETLFASTESAGEQTSYAWGQRLAPRHLGHRLVYSLDLFLPVVQLGLEEKWLPNGTGPQVYAPIHTFFGWLLVPLLLASLAGYLKRPS